MGWGGGVVESRDCRVDGLNGQSGRSTNMLFFIIFLNLVVFNLDLGFWFCFGVWGFIMDALMRRPTAECGTHWRKNRPVAFPILSLTPGCGVPGPETTLKNLVPMPPLGERVGQKRLKNDRTSVAFVSLHPPAQTPIWGPRGGTTLAVARS